MIRETVEKYKGKKFTVVFLRDTMERRYVLETFEEDGTLKPRNEPLYAEEFIKHYGFSYEWPHEKIVK
jgi:hypothetical protein